MIIWHAYTYILFIIIIIRAVRHGPADRYKGERVRSYSPFFSNRKRNVMNVGKKISLIYLSAKNKKYVDPKRSVCEINRIMSPPRSCNNGYVVEVVVFTTVKNTDKWIERIVES